MLHLVSADTSQPGHPLIWASAVAISRAGKPLPAQSWSLNFEALPQLSRPRNPLWLDVLQWERNSKSSCPQRNR